MVDGESLMVGSGTGSRANGVQRPLTVSRTCTEVRRGEEDGARHVERNRYRPSHNEKLRLLYPTPPP
jgi:hypothetical protein